MRNSIFDLEPAIASWRHALRMRRTFLDDDLDELEDHLRKEIERPRLGGLTEKEAFSQSTVALGTQVELESAFEPVRFGRNKRKQNFKSEVLFGISMIGHYLYIATRSFKRQFAQSMINVVGLAVALSTCLFIGLYINDELSFDKFYDQSDQIFRVQTQGIGGKSALMPASTSDFPSTSMPGVISTIHVDFVASMTTLPLVSYNRIMEKWSVFYTYVKLTRETSLPALSQLMHAHASNMDSAASGELIQFKPITRIHLYSGLSNELETNGDIRYVFLLGTLGLLLPKNSPATPRFQACGAQDRACWWSMKYPHL
jgi:hypothetical protein